VEIRYFVVADSDLGETRAKPDALVREPRDARGLHLDIMG
jgi:hypothetical protein